MTLDSVFSVGLDLLALAVPISIAATNIIFFPLAALWLFGARWTFKKWPPVWGRPENFFLIFLGTSVISALLGQSPWHSLHTIYNKDFYILITVVLVALIRSPDKNNRLFRVFMAAGVATAIWGLMQCAIGVNQSDKSGGYFLHLPTLLAHWPRPLLDLLSMVYGRVIGTRGHPLAYAECLLFNWAFAVSFLVSCRGKAVLKWMLYTLLIGAGLVVSQSRGPWIAAALIAVCVILTTASKRAWLILGMCAFFFALFSTIPVLRDRAVSILDKSHESNAERLHMWKAGWHIWKSHPLLGIGPGNVSQAAKPYEVGTESLNGGWGHLHSIYVNVLAERGLLGFTTFFVFLGVLWREVWQAMRSLKDDSWNYAFYRGTLLSILGFLVCGVTETTYNTAVEMMMFYFVLGLALAAARHHADIQRS